MTDHQPFSNPRSDIRHDSPSDSDSSLAGNINGSVNRNINETLDGCFAEIDWQAPWLRHLCQLDYLSRTIISKSIVQPSEQEIGLSSIAPLNHSPDVVAAVLNTALQQRVSDLAIPPPTTEPTHHHQAQTLRFVSQAALPEGESYECFIGESGNIPTRDNLHDLFNGSIWLTFPKTKALLNHYHMLEIAEQGVSESRGRVRDTITVFDENGAVLVTADASIGDALIDFDWQASLVNTRKQWDDPKQPNPHAEAAVYIFGHALLEQLIHPRKPLCAHSIVINVTADFFALSLSQRMQHLDDRVANYMGTLLSQQGVTPRQLAPLPILGVPYFWEENHDSHFYEDTYVFRSGRRKKPKR
ncbi:DUF3025 domain-containing protein [Psychrobacter sp.]|uniref:DUF3025 domain-containing protein n=1 Tax=Psychrobacter sp. TaxID=56811 RepID=UPI003F9C1402